MESTQRVLADSQKQLLDLVTANKQLKNQLEAGEELNKDKDRDTGGNVSSLCYLLSYLLRTIVTDGFIDSLLSNYLDICFILVYFLIVVFSD